VRTRGWRGCYRRPVSYNYHTFSTTHSHFTHSPPHSLTLIITLLTKRSSGQRWKLCIMYHIGSDPPPSFLCLSGCYSTSFPPSFLPSSAHSLPLSRICILRIRYVCAIAAAAAVVAVAAAVAPAAIEHVEDTKFSIKTNIIFGCNCDGKKKKASETNGPRRLSVCLRVLVSPSPRARRMSLL
jgi:hypothetical protein